MNNMCSVRILWDWNGLDMIGHSAGLFAGDCRGVCGALQSSAELRHFLRALFADSLRDSRDLVSPGQASPFQLSPV